VDGGWTGFDKFFSLSAPGEWVEKDIKGVDYFVEKPKFSTESSPRVVEKPERGTAGERCSFFSGEKERTKEKPDPAKYLRRGESLPLEGEGGPRSGG